MPIIINYPNCQRNTIITNQVNETVNIYLWPKVENEIRCYCEYRNNNFIFISPLNGNNIKYKKIFIIVESPHKDEFDSIFCPIRPLNGSSGFKFNNNILNKLNIWFNNSNLINIGDLFEIHIVNPVRYQTSLYHYFNSKIPYDIPNNNYNYNQINSYIRDETWRILFAVQSIRDDFLNYLNKYTNDKKLFIVNCCTGYVKNKYNTFTQLGLIKNVRKNTKKLKLLVRDAIKLGCNSNNYYMEDIHPICW